jgi:hypothetical protein
VRRLLSNDDMRALAWRIRDQHPDLQAELTPCGCIAPEVPHEEIPSPFPGRGLVRCLLCRTMVLLNWDSTRLTKRKRSAKTNIAGVGAARILIASA